ncbi:MAG: hypothetical protein QOH17_4195 [Pseudonocardiales bacterium]|nr:hypothetical protein [Pseudonocardiales bacterium]
MRQNPGRAGAPPRQDDVTVRLAPGVLPAAHEPPPDGVTVMVPGAVLAPAPTPQVTRPGEAPVFVDDSGARKRMLRITGVLIALLSIGFIAIVGVALAVPNVATSVGLGSVVPFIVPGAAAVPPPPLATPAPRVQLAQPKPRLRPSIVAAPVVEPEPVAVDPTTTPTAETTSSVTAEPTATQAPVGQTTAPPAPDGTQAGNGQAPVATDPPVAGG